MEDHRTDKQKEKAKSTAEFLRQLADQVEDSIIRETNIQISADHQTQFIDDTEYNYTDGDMDYVINLRLYNPNMDNRAQLLKDIKK